MHSTRSMLCSVFTRRMDAQNGLPLFNFVPETHDVEKTGGGASGAGA